MKTGARQEVQFLQKTRRLSRKDATKRVAVVAAESGIIGHRLGGLIAGDTRKIKKEYLMRLQEWEVTIQEIIDECNHEPKQSSGDRILTKWRAKLEQEPTLLQPFQIDEIVRAVRQRLSTAS